jgi:hypothetical protein
MNSEQLNKWAGTKYHGSNKSPLIRQLQTGTVAGGQGSSLAPVADVGPDYIITNAVPFVDFPQHVAPVGTPGRQNLHNLPTAQIAPWISVPLCAHGVRPVKSANIGLTGGSSSVLNLPSKRVPKSFNVSSFS